MSTNKPPFTRRERVGQGIGLLVILAWNVALVMFLLYACSGGAS